MIGEPIKNPFEPFFEEIRRIVREEIKAASNGNGHNLLTAEQLAEKLQMHPATIYQKVKAKKIPFHQVGRFLRFDLEEVLRSDIPPVPASPRKKKKKKETPLDTL